MSAIELEAAHGALVPAPVTGVRLGVTTAGPFTVRLLRARGTHLAVLDNDRAAFLLALRAAAAGVPVAVGTERPAPWQRMVRAGVPLSLQRAGVEATVTVPSLFVDDRPSLVGSLGRPNPWQARIDVRSLWDASDLAAAARADAVVVGPALTADVAAAAVAIFGISRADADTLVRVAPGSASVLVGGDLRLVQLDPGPIEHDLIEPKP